MLDSPTDVGWCWMELHECETVLGRFSRHGTVLDMLRECEIALESANKCDMDDMDTIGYYN